MKHGKGTDFFTNGDKLTGNYSLGKPEGFCTHIWADGSIYEGEFVNGLKDGKGKWKKALNYNQEES